MKSKTRDGFTTDTLLILYVIIFQTITQADISTVKKLGKPPHLIMRIMDCCLILFRKKIIMNEPDPEKYCPKPSWGEAMKVSV